MRHEREVRFTALSWGGALAIAAGLCTSGVFAQSDDRSNWKVIELDSVDRISAKLRYRSHVSAADQKWLILELINQCGHDQLVRHLSYRIECNVAPVGSASSVSSRLCLGSTLEVFPEDWDSTPVAHHWLIDQSLRESHKAISQRATASMLRISDRLEDRDGVSKKTEMTVNATAHITMGLSFGGNSTGTRLKTPVAGIPFSFRWIPPGESGIRKMQNWLRVWCLRERYSDGRGAPSARLAWAYLNTPEVVAGLSDEALKTATAVDGWGTNEFRFAAHRRLFERDPANDGFIQEHKRRIEESPSHIISLEQSDFWHPDLAGSVANSTYDYSAFYSDAHMRMAAHRGLAILEKHREDWQNDREVVKVVDAAKQRIVNGQRLNILLGVAAIIGPLLTVIFLIWFAWRRSRRGRLRGQ